MKMNLVKRILIVDDDVLILYAFSHALCGDDVEVKTVATGNEAIFQINSCFYDLCFLDIDLPDVNGLTIMNWLKETSPETKVAIMTASYVDDRMKKTIGDKADYFIAKPFDLSEIKAIARSALETGGICQKGKNYENGFGQEKRRFTRKPLKKDFNFSVSVLERGKLKDLSLTGDIVDISEQGVGIKIDYPLVPGHIIRFASGIEKEAGIARWCLLVESRNKYRVGIQFV